VSGRLTTRLALPQVKTLLGKLAGLSPTPTIALAEATELLCKSLDASLVR
jgi:hypothetical protein